MCQVNSQMFWGSPQRTEAPRIGISLQGGGGGRRGPRVPFVMPTVLSPYTHIGTSFPAATPHSTIASGRSSAAAPQWSCQADLIADLARSNRLKGLLRFFRGNMTWSCEDVSSFKIRNPSTVSVASAVEAN